MVIPAIWPPISERWILICSLTDLPNGDFRNSLGFVIGSKNNLSSFICLVIIPKGILDLRTAFHTVQEGHDPFAFTMDFVIIKIAVPT